jgi:hypothetical protein
MANDDNVIRIEEWLRAKKRQQQVYYPVRDATMPYGYRWELIDASSVIEDQIKVD